MVVVFVVVVALLSPLLLFVLPLLLSLSLSSSSLSSWLFVFVSGASVLQSTPGRTVRGSTSPVIPTRARIMATASKLETSLSSADAPLVSHLSQIIVHFMLFPPSEYFDALINHKWSLCTGSYHLYFELSISWFSIFVIIIIILPSIIIIIIIDILIIVTINFCYW